MDLNSLGKKLRDARKSKGLTQEKLAEIVSISPNHISILERNIKFPKLETLVKIANALDLSTDELLVDVVNKAKRNRTDELLRKISDLPKEEQQRLLDEMNKLIK